MLPNESYLTVSDGRPAMRVDDGAIFRMRGCAGCESLACERCPGSRLGALVDPVLQEGWEQFAEIQAKTEAAGPSWLEQILPTIGQGMQQLTQFGTQAFATVGPAYLQFRQAQQAIEALKTQQATARITQQNLLEKMKIEQEIERAKMAQQLALARIKAETQQAQARYVMGPPTPSTAAVSVPPTTTPRTVTPTPGWVVPVVAIAGVGLVGMVLFVALRK